MVSAFPPLNLARCSEDSEPSFFHGTFYGKIYVADLAGNRR